MYRRRTNFGNIIVMRSETLAQSQETLRSGESEYDKNLKAIQNATFQKSFDRLKIINP